jgi:phage portal protein BeeE
VTASAPARSTTAGRKTAALPAILTPYLGSYQGPGFGSSQSGGAAGSIPAVLPKPSAVSLRRFAETPVARRAINLVKDRIASMDWQVRVRRGYDASKITDLDQKVNALRLALEQPNPSDSFRTLWEGVLEDTLVGGFGAVEMKSTGDATRPFELWAIDGACVEIDPLWTGDIETPRYGFRTGRPGIEAITPLRDDELIYVRLNTRTHTPFGLGRLEVAYESIGQLLSASRYAGRLASNSVVQYALWLDEATPEQHDRLIRWWQDEIEGTGRVPVLSCEKKPEVLRFAGGTDADLRLQWQEFLIRMIGNAFDLPPMLLGLESDVNRSTAGELADEAFQAAVVPVAKLIAEHITRDLFGKCIGWPEFEFVFNELESRDEQEEVAIQVQLLQAGVLSVAEVRAMRGLPPAVPTESPARKQAGSQAGSQAGNQTSEETP